MDSSLSSSGTGSSDGGCGGCLCGGIIKPLQAFSGDNKNATIGAPPTLTDDALLAKELNELSFEEREKVFDDIHGVTRSVQETPEFIDKVLKKFDKEASELPRTKRQALDRAIFLKPSIESDKKFKLMFLRADDYNALRAARRMAKYFEHKAELFGEEKLVKTITLDDFTKEDMELFRSGPFLRGPNKDGAGRPVWLSNMPKFDFIYPKSLLRCSWYMIMTSLEDEATQIKGACNIVYCPSGWKFSVSLSQFWDAMIKGGEMLANLPARTTCSHFCYDSASMEVVLSACRKVLGKKQMLRLRSHYGSGLELQYKLMAFGIKFPYFLEDDNGYDPKVQQHLKFIEHRARIEQATRQQQEEFYRETIRMDNRNKAKGSSELMIPYPELNDVLVGRGSPYQTYPGNVMLSQLIDNQFLERYSRATDNFEKNCLHMDVVTAIQEVCGGRFLERTPQGWKVVHDKVARKKVNSSFRSKMAKHQPPSSATSTRTIGEKLKQPFSTLSHDNTNSGGGFVLWGSGDAAHAKRARYS